MEELNGAGNMSEDMSSASNTSDSSIGNGRGVAESMNMTDTSNGSNGGNTSSAGDNRSSMDTRARGASTVVSNGTDMGNARTVNNTGTPDSISAISTSTSESAEVNASGSNATVLPEEDDKSKTPVTVIVILVGLGVLGFIIAAIAIGLWRYQKKRQQAEDGNVYGFGTEMSITVESAKKTHIEDVIMESPGIFVETDQGYGFALLLCSAVQLTVSCNVVSQFTTAQWLDHQRGSGLCCNAPHT